jgi:hypothetical protein
MWTAIRATGSLFAFRQFTSHAFVMRGHSPSKTGVNALVTRASIILRKRWIAGSRRFAAARQ